MFWFDGLKHNQFDFVWIIVYCVHSRKKERGAVMEVSALLNPLPYGDTALSYLDPEDQIMLRCISDRFFSVFHDALCVVEIDGQHYFIGIQISKMLHRETSNTYRSMKRAGIVVRRASPNEVRNLNVLNLCCVNKTHSVTFVPLRAALRYVNNGMLGDYMFYLLIYLCSARV